MRTHQLQAETVKRPDVGAVEQCELFVPAKIAGCLSQLLLEAIADSLPHFGGGGFGESDHQDLLERHFGLFLEQAMQATLDQCAGLASAGSRRDQNISVRRDSLLLCEGEAHKFSC